MLMTTKQYAEHVGRHRDTILQRIYRGKLEAIRIGNTWLVDSETPFVDHRRKEHYDLDAHPKWNKKEEQETEDE